MKFITPYLPDEAIREIKAWQLTGKAAFQVAVEQGDKSECKNCGDLGFVIVRLTDGGPYRNIQASKTKSCTWFDGNEISGKGWYVIGKTMEYTCPACKGGNVYHDDPGDYIEIPERVSEGIGKLKWWEK